MLQLLLLYYVLLLPGSSFSIRAGQRAGTAGSLTSAAEVITVRAAVVVGCVAAQNMAPSLLPMGIG